MSIVDIGSALGNAMSNLGNYSAQAASRANSISQYAQSAQGQFNQNSVDLANEITDRRIAEQYAFNAAQAAAANDFTREMWEQTAAYNREMYNDSKEYNSAMWERNSNWNEAMYNRQMEFNSAEAEKNRQWQQHMMETSYQRAMKDMEAAGLNPILAYQGINGSIGGGATASTGGVSLGASSISPASISSAQGAAANGGISNASYASESNYTGQMEYLSGTLGLISAAIGATTSAFKQFGTLGDLGRNIGQEIYDGLSKVFKYTEDADSYINNQKDKLNHKIGDWFKNVQ